LISDFFNVSRSTWAILLTIVALLAFVAVTLVQQKVTNEKADWSRANIFKTVKWSALPIAILIFIAATPTRDEFVMAKLEKKAKTGECAPKLIDADKLAYELINNYYAYNLIDIRSKEEYDSFHIATAINIPLEQLKNLEYRPLFRQRIKTNVFYGVSLSDASRACLLARYHGDVNGLALKENADQFYQLFFLPKMLGATPTKQELTIKLFRESAARKMEEIETAVSSMSKPIEKKVRVVQGGCS